MMTENKINTQVSENDIALWLGREIMGKNIIIKNLENKILELEKCIEEQNKASQFKKVEG